MSEVLNTEPATLYTLKEVFHRTKVGDDFPESLLQDLLNAADLVNYMPDDVILQQGEVNHNLFFLVIGTLDIFVDNGRVNSLASMGDLVGEMSVITGQPCSATIRAQTPAQLLRLDTEKLRAFMGDRQAEFNAILYRIYSLILASKLAQTNQKAKQLEGTLAALSRAKNEIQEVHRSMEQRVSERIQGLKRSLETLLTNHLTPLQASMKQLKEQMPAKEKGAFDGCLKEIEGVVRTVIPIATNLSSEVSIKNKRVLVADSVKKNILTAKMALGGTGVVLETAESINEAKEKLNETQYDLILLDKEHLDLHQSILSTSPKARVVFMTSERIETYLPKLQQVGITPNIVARDEDDRALTIRNIMTTVSKLASNGLFGLEKYLNWGVDVHELTVQRSDEREKLREQMVQYFTGLGVRRSILDHVNLVAEELLMNAIYDAPTDVNGNAKYNKLSRQEKVELRAEEQGRFRFGTDGTFAAISVEDPFGALTAETILKYLESCYGDRAGELNKEKGGAGRGLHQIIENSTLVVFNVAPGKRTEVIALFYIVPGDKRERTPQFHYFTA